MKKLALIFIGLALFTACKKKGCNDPTADNYNSEAEKNDGSCLYSNIDIPENYVFTDDAGNNTVNYSGQTERLNQMEEFSVYMKSGNNAVLDLSILKAMFKNTGGNANGNYSFSSTKDLYSKCFPADTGMYMAYLDSLQLASTEYMYFAEPGLAGTLNSNDLSKKYLFAASGIEYAQIIEKGIMGAVFMYQATQVYFGTEKMNVDNSSSVDAANSEFYTEMEHHWDEAFGYFGVAVDFPANTTDIRFWGKYCNSVDPYINSNTAMMNYFKRGRAAISEEKYDVRDNDIANIRLMWERIAARQAIEYLDGAIANFGTDQAIYLHELSEAYAFILCLKYLPLETRVITYSEIEDLLDNKIGSNLWNTTSLSLTEAKQDLQSIYEF